MRKTGILQGGSIEGREKAAAKKGQFSFLKFHKSIYILFYNWRGGLLYASKC